MTDHCADPMILLIVPIGVVINRFRPLIAFLVSVAGFGAGSVLCGLAQVFWALKGNQGTLAKEVQETFTLAQTDQFAQIQHQFYQTVNKGHGRLEIRKHWIIDDPEYIAYLNPKGVWKGLRSIGMVQSERRIGE